MPWPWQLGSGSVKVIGNVNIRQSAYDFLLTFYSNYGFYLVSFVRHSMSKNVVTLKLGSEITQGHWKWCHSIDRVWFPSNVVPKTHCFWDIRLVSIQWPWNPGLESFKVIWTDTNRSAAYDFPILLTFHGNHGPMLYRFRDKWQFQSKIGNFPTPCILSPRWRGSP